MSAASETLIRHLFEVPAAAALIEQWYIAEWGPWYGPSGLGDAKADLAACHDRDEIPLCLVAQDPGGALLGTAALKALSAGSEHRDGPWMAALLVPEAQRGRGVGSALVAAVEAEAVRLGYNELYSSTDRAMGILERRGWQAIGTTRTLRGLAMVYRRQFKT